jgi:3-oxoacyl-[acyl-carrier protein] reductase
MANYLIVGSSSGIGASLSKHLLENGHHVIGMSRTNKNSLATHFAFDVTSSDPFPVIDGAIDGLVYCPGSIVLKPFRALKEHDFLHDFHLNLVSAIKTIQAYLPNLQLSESPSIVLFSTVAVQTGMPFHASVAAAKGAVEGVTRSLAAEFAPKIRVNCIAPSLTDTPLASRLLDSETKIAGAKDRHPLKKIASADEIAQMAAFLISPAAGFMTGQIVKMDGGISSIKS